MQRILVWIGLIFSLSLLVPSAVWAQDTATTETPTVESTDCRCFCRSRGGAMDLDFVLTTEACEAQCKIEGQKILGCYKEERQYPKNNDLCWTKEACESQDSTESIEAGGQTKPQEWGGQEPICMPGSGFCYNKPNNIPLGIEIGGVSETEGLAHYISIIYNWLIPAASILAVVMMMVAGLQWMLAGGNQTTIGKAKERLIGAVSGLVLLLLAYTIAFFIDPNLTSFKELRIPKIKEVVFLDPTSSCEALMLEGLVVAPLPPEDSDTAPATCGAKGVISVPEGTSVIGWKTGDTCYYNKCTDGYSSCMLQRTGENEYKGECLRCAGVYSGSDLDYSPSPGNCAMLKYDPALQGEDSPDPNQKYYCEYSKSFSVAGIDFGASCVEYFYPRSKHDTTDGGEPGIDCELLRQDARSSGSESCRAYDNVFVNFFDTGVDSFSLAHVDMFTGDDENYYVKQICEDDPCGFGEDTSRATGQDINCDYYDFYREEQGFYEEICGASFFEYIPFLSSLPGCLTLQSGLAHVGCYDSNFTAEKRAVNSEAGRLWQAGEYQELGSFLLNAETPVCTDVNGDSSDAICKALW